MKLSTYLYFDGCCAEAFEFYRTVFGGEFSTRLTFAEGPLEVPDAESGRIMHISLPVGEDELQGSDTVSTSGKPAKPSNNFAITLRPTTRDEADTIFAGLMEGGVRNSCPKGMFLQRFAVTAELQRRWKFLPEGGGKFLPEGNVPATLRCHGKFLPDGKFLPEGNVPATLRRNSCPKGVKFLPEG